MAAGVRGRLRGTGADSHHRAGSSGEFWRRQRLLRHAPAWRLQRKGPTRTQFPPASARVAPITGSSCLTRMNEIELTKKAPDFPSFRLSHGDWPLIRHEQMTPPAYSAGPIRRG